MSEKKKAIIAGATSGMGYELAKILAAEGYAVGVTGRREEILNKMKTELGGEIYVKTMDVRRTREAMKAMSELIEEMGGSDLIVLSSGVAYVNPKLAWEKDEEIIDTNVKGFAALANVAYNYFNDKKGGHLVAISSIAGIRGGGTNSAYAASKAFMINYLEGLRLNAAARRNNVVVTDIRPGYVDTPLLKGMKGLFWVVPAQKAAEQIYGAIKSKKKYVYVSKRWALVACVLRRMPQGGLRLMGM